MDPVLPLDRFWKNQTRGKLTLRRLQVIVETRARPELKGPNKSPTPMIFHNIL